MKLESLNNRFILESYKEDRSLKKTVSNGFAMVSQKNSIKGLKLLIDANISIGQELVSFSAGCTVYIREEYLLSQPWAKKTFSCESIAEDFIIVESQFVEFIGP